MIPWGRTSVEPLPPVGRGSRGFALVEALVAAALIGWILLVGLEFLVLEQRAEDKMRAHREALGIVESVLEAVRARPDLAVEGPLDLEALGYDTDVLVRLEVATEEPYSDLIRLRVEATYQVHHQTLKRDLETLLWQP